MYFQSSPTSPGGISSAIRFGDKNQSFISSAVASSHLSMSFLSPNPFISIGGTAGMARLGACGPSELQEYRDDGCCSTPDYRRIRSRREVREIGWVKEAKKLWRNEIEY
jgi:hypothetical protein